MVQVRINKTVNYAEEDDSDSENVVTTANRKPKAEGAAALSSKVRLLTPRAANRKKQATAAEDVGDTNLIDIVKKHGTALSVAAKDWIEKYKVNRTRSTAEVLSFLIQACGVDEHVSEEELEELEVDQLKQGLDEKAQAEGLEDPFKAKGQKNFRSNYLELWDKIIREAYHNEVLFDQYLLDKVINLLIALNTSVVRNFRRVATLTAVQLVTSFIYITRILEEGRATAERQLAVEEKKKGGKSGSERIVAFKRTVDRNHLRVKELSSYTDSVFQAVCQHRFRDCAEDIRATVIEGIGHWIKNHPADFLSDQYLKYIAWALSDKDAVVRGCAVSALLGLYSQRDNLSPLHDFTERFAARFKELVYDVDESVAVKGVQLLTVLVHLDEIPAASVKDVYTLLGDESHGIRHAVAELVAGMLQEQGERVVKQVAGKSTGKKQRRKSGEGAATQQHSKEELQLAGLLHVMHLLANEEGRSATRDGGGMDIGEARPLAKEVSAQVVDALFDRVEVLSNWALMVDWLKGSKAVEHFEDAGLTNLVQILRQALTKATGGQLLANQVADKKARGKERQDAQAAARQDATLVLMKELPTLLKKLQTNPVQAATMVGIITELKLEIYSLKHQDKEFSSLMGIVKDIMFKHDDMQVAQECVRTLAICAREGSDSIKDAAQLALRQCSEAAIKQLKSATTALQKFDAMELSSTVEAFQEEGEDEEHEVLYNCRLGLGRLKALQLLDSGVASSEVVYGMLNRLLEAVASGQPMTAPIITAALSNMLLLLLWQLWSLEAEHPDGDALRSLGEKRAAFVAKLEIIIDSEQDDVRREACQVLSDLCLCFSGEKMRGSPLETACFRPSNGAVEKMWRCWESVIMQEAEEGMTEQAAAALVTAKVRTVSKAAQLVVFQSIPQRVELAAQLISHYVGQEREVTETVKEVCRLLKKIDPNGLPDIYLSAMKASFGRAAEHLSDDNEDDEALDQFVSLSQSIAQVYVGFNASAPALGHICGKGAVWALEGAPDRLPFLQGVACFLSRLPAVQAQATLREVEAAAKDAPSSAEEAEYPWNLYFDFVRLLGDRVVKGVGPKSALKRSAGGSSVKKGGTTRKISFMPDEGIEEVSDEEQEPQEPDEIEDDHQENDNESGPSSQQIRRAGRDGRQSSQKQLQVGSGFRRQSQQRSQGMAAAPSSGVSRGKRVAAGRERRAEQEIEEVEEEEEESDQKEAEEEEEQRDEDDEVLPTEEQLPVMPAGRNSGRRRQHRQFRAVLQPEEGEKEGHANEEQEDEDGIGDDSDLPDIKGRSKPVVDRRPEAEQQHQHQQQEDGDEDATQELRRARRRRRH